MKQERQDRLNQLRHKLAGLTEAERQAFTDRGIIATVEGRTLSRYNTYMVYIQCNGTAPSVVGGYKQWKAAGRQVMKGQHGLSILFPVGNKDKETGDILEATHFYAGTVFDITQTEVIEAGDTTSPAKGDTAKADYRVSGIKKANEYKHTYNIYEECPDKTRQEIAKRLDNIDRPVRDKISNHPIVIGVNGGELQPYGDIELMVDGKPGISLDGDNKAGEVKKFMKSAS